jgi:hypothetical protein
MKKVSDLIENLNKPKFGSFGEFIFKTIATKKFDVINKHKDGIDFIVDGIPVDVGTSNRINKKSSLPKKDALVLFYIDHVKVQWNDKINETLDNSEIETYFNSWIQVKHQSKYKKNKSMPSIYIKELVDLKSEINSFFNNKGFRVRIIHRTVSKKFGYRESPHNLLPKNINDGLINIYLDFKNEKTTKDNINFVVAFKSSDSNLVLRQKRFSIKSGNNTVSKIDLSYIVERKNNSSFLFDSIESLFRNFL